MSLSVVGQLLFELHFFLDAPARVADVAQAALTERSGSSTKGQHTLFCRETRYCRDLRCF